MAGIDSLLLERLLVGGLLAGLAVTVAFGPELRRAVARIRQRDTGERRSITVGPNPS